MYVPSYNGESIGRWEGDTLVVDTRNFETHQHYIDRLVPLSEQFRIVERISSIENGDRLSIEFTMTDPENWEGDWIVTKTFRRQERMDFVESPCLPNTNEACLRCNNSTPSASGTGARQLHEKFAYLAARSSIAPLGSRRPSLVRDLRREQADDARRRGQEFRWTNPHSWVFLTVTNADGSETVWEIEHGPVNMLRGKVGRERRSSPAIGSGGNPSRARRAPDRPIHRLQFRGRREAAASRATTRAARLRECQAGAGTDGRCCRA